MTSPSALEPTASPLTSPDDWNRYWEQARRLPVVVAPGDQASTAAILGILDRFATAERPLRVLEVGGAPGGYAAHLHTRFGHQVSVLDSSPLGVEMTRRNFELLGIPGTVMHRDLFAPDPGEQFDLVYSLGLIEHFSDTQEVVAAHLAYLKPGGTLVLGCPNLLGVNGMLLRRLSPSALEWHHLGVMDIRTWPSFERALGLRVRFRGYVGGFDPGMFWRRERGAFQDKLLGAALDLLARHWRGSPARAVSRWNSRRWSYYAMGVYEKAAA